MAVNKAYVLISMVALFGFTSIVTVTGRCYVRARIVKAVGWDDIFAVLALITFLLFTVTVCIGVSLWKGKHQYEVDPGVAALALKCWYSGYICYCVSVTLMKMSVGIFLLRITINRVQRLIIHITLFFSLAVGFCFMGVVVFQCTPVDFFWTKVYPDSSGIGQCIPANSFVALGYTYSAISASTDLVMGVLPIVMVYHLDMDRRTKAILAPVLSMGAIAACAPLVRCAYMPTLASPDFLYETLDIAIWSTIEPGLALTASSLATIGPLFRAFLRHVGIEEVPTFKLHLNVRRESLVYTMNSCRPSQPHRCHPHYLNSQAGKWAHRQRNSPYGNFALKKDGVAAALDRMDFDVWAAERKGKVGSLASLQIDPHDTKEESISN